MCFSPLNFDLATFELSIYPILIIIVSRLPTIPCSKFVFYYIYVGKWAFPTLYISSPLRLTFILYILITSLTLTFYNYLEEHSNPLLLQNSLQYIQGRYITVLVPILLTNRQKWMVRWPVLTLTLCK